MVRFTGLGRKRLDEISPSDIERLYNRIRKTGNKRTQGALSGRSVLHVHRVLFAAMQRAVSWRLISSNPCVSEAPKAKRYEARTLTAEQGRLLIETARTTRLYLPIMLALGCGLRRGEVCALKWAGVDFERGTVHISESIQDKAVFVAPKTERSRRTIALPATVLAALRSHFHDLRHSAASLLIERGVPVTTVSEMLGHANSAITLSIYAHSVKGAEERAASTMDGLLKGVETGW